MDSAITRSWRLAAAVLAALPVALHCQVEPSSSEGLDPTEVVGFEGEREISVAQVLDAVEKYFVPGLREQLVGSYGAVVRRSDQFQNWVDSYLDLLALLPDASPKQLALAQRRARADAAEIVAQRIEKMKREVLEASPARRPVAAGSMPPVPPDAFAAHELRRLLYSQGLSFLVRSLAEEIVHSRPTYEDLQRHFAEHAMRYGGKVRCAVVFFSFQDAVRGCRMPAEGRRAVLEQAGQVYRDLVAGASFEEMVRRYSDDKRSAARKGDLGWISYLHSGLPESATEILFWTPKGNTTKPIATRRGVYIFKVLDRRNRENPSFLKVRKLVEEDYLRDRARHYLEQARERRGIRAR